jgi:tellurite resistance protein TehA-like permease
MNASRGTDYKPVPVLVLDLNSMTKTWFLVPVPKKFCTLIGTYLLYVVEYHACILIMDLEFFLFPFVTICEKTTESQGPKNIAKI